MIPAFVAGAMGYRPAMSNPSEETFRSDLRDGGRNDEGHEGTSAIPSPGQSAEDRAS